MIKKQKINKMKNGKVRVTFAMPAINGCNCMYLVGRFSEWNESVYRMQRADDGIWSLTLELAPGRDYRYRYRTDNGVWLNDPAAEAYVVST
ncbi:MAG TPA: isoamylase early set domain-containing protein [Anaerolineales bacterium]